MSSFINKQNKHHFALYRYNDFVNWQDSGVNWADTLLNKRSQSLNEQVSKISPRRGKKEQKRIEEEIIAIINDEIDLFEISNETLEELDDVT